MTAPARPVLRWHGGKFRDRRRIIAHFSPHRVYVEPYGGAASVLLCKDRAYAEVYNDLDAEVVGLFRVLRSERAPELIAALRLTPFARDEFEAAYAPAACDVEAAYAPAACDVEAARRLVVRSFMGFGSDGHNGATRTGFRPQSSRSHTTPAHDWANYPPALHAVVARLAGVVIENKPAIEVMAQHDGPATLHFLDPPYLPEVRSQKSRKGGLKYHCYAHEMARADHVALLAFVRELEGMVVISGYPSALYDGVLADWHRVTWAALADGARPRTEVLWINPAALAGRDLFAHAEAGP